MIEIKTLVESYKVVAMCTTHLTPEDIEALELAVENGDQKVLKRDSGFFIKLYTDPKYPEGETSNMRHGKSQEIKNIIQWAVRAGYGMIEFDRDADEIPEIPVFDL